MRTDKIDNTNQGYRIEVLYPLHKKPIVFESLFSFVKKKFLGNKNIAKDLGNQIRDRQEIEFKGYKIKKI